MSDGLLFILKDFDKLGGNEKLGVVSVPAKMLYEAKGERMEFKLQPPGYKNCEIPGYMAIRCRRASSQDIQFMEENSKPSFKQFDFLKQAIAEGKTGAGNIKSILSKRTRIASSGKNAGKKLVSRLRHQSLRRSYWQVQHLTLPLESIKFDQDLIHSVQKKLLG